MKPIKVRVKRDLRETDLIGKGGSEQVYFPKETIGTLLTLTRVDAQVHFGKKYYPYTEVYLLRRDLEVVK